jgi:SAM-dependent methyltransferase
MSVAHWESYYRGGALASCPVGPGDDYTGELRNAWVEFFSRLPSGARILDIGTGNGAIPLIALDCASAAGNRFEIDATDLARIDPVRDVKDGARRFAGIRFHPQVATEELPFEASRFDAISGQYALEYANVELALSEINRVLAGGGSAQFILHHANSVVAQNARATLDQAALVLDETMILRKLRRYLQAARRSERAGHNARADLDAALDGLRRAAADTRNPRMLDVTLDAVDKLAAARQVLAPAALDREVDRFEGDVRASVHRLQDLLRCCQTEPAMHALAQAARALQFNVRELALQVQAGSRVIGWRLRIEKP